MQTNHARLVIVSLLVFVLLAMLHTWPLAAAPAHWSRVDPGDGALNIWAVGWVGRAIWHSPTQIFNANIFYPEKLTLAYSEAMLVQGVFAAPVIALTGSAVLAYNVSLLAGLALTGWAFCLLVQRWTSSWSAGYIAGSLAAFNAYTLVQLTHLQFQHAEFIAVMVFALDRLIVTARLRDAWWLAVAFTLQSLASIYLMVFSVWMLLFAVAARIRDCCRRGAVTMVLRFAAAGIIAILMLSPYLREYRQVHDTMGFARGVEDEESASVANYLSTGARIHFERWSRAFVAESTSNTFPGIIAIGLLIAAISDRQNTGDARFRMCGVAAAGCAAISFAPQLPWYRALHSAIPLFQAVRVLPHLGQIVLLMFAVLAGFGVATLQQAWRHARSWPAIAVLLLIMVNGEALRAPVGYTWFDGVPHAYGVLAKEPAAVVAEIPFPMPEQWFLNTAYMGTRPAIGIRC
ncbi:MAG TPA: hypothetical protein VF491_18670 [Vicinamibacterales bacterium]